MVSKMTNCLEADRAKRLDEQSEYRSQTATTLYVRHGLLMSLGCDNPTREKAEAIIDDFKSRFQRWQASYKESVSLAAKVSASASEFVADDFRVGWEEQTALVLDCPRLRISDEGTIFEMRTCVGICPDKASAKVWSRVSPPIDIPDYSPRLRVDQVPELCPRFRCIVDKSTGWAFHKMREVLPRHLPDSRLETKGTIKATILGIADGDLATPFERLCEEETTAADVLQDAELDQKLTSYCQMVSAIDGMLSSYIQPTGHNKAVWFRIPLSVVLQGGEVAYRVVLFCMRDIEGYSEIIGLAYDDSEKGDLALRAGAKLSKIIGPWI